MKCQYRTCQSKAEYFYEGRKWCYEHVTETIGHSPVNFKPRADGLLAPEVRTHHKPVKSIKVVEEGRDYAGTEKSPYWEWAQQNSPRDEGTGHITETPIANPDELSEDDTMYHRPLSAEGEEQLETIQNCLPELTPLQQRVLYLVAQLGLPQVEVAKQLGVTPGAVEDTLRRIKNKINKRYQKNKV